MKYAPLCLATFLLTVSIALLAFHALSSRPIPPEPLAERWSPPAATPPADMDAGAGDAKPVAVATAEAPGAANVVARAVDVPRPGPVARTPRLAPRRCPPSVMNPEPFVREGRCPPPMPPGGTPLVLSPDGAPVAYVAGRADAFDLFGDASVVTAWPTANTPWLALDRDGDGRISDGSELFGSMTVLASGERAPDGFAALRELDADGDGRITPNDPGFARLLVWTDGDGDRRSSPGELVSAAEWGLVSIDLDFTVDPRCDERDNCEVERATFRFRDGSGVVRTGAVIDVHLAPQR